jgi:hemolysin activation/secretion protein
METEIYNPTRRFKNFRPREAVRALKAQAVPTNRATISIYNNSTGPRVIVLRDFTVSGTANDMIATSYANGQVGSSQGLVAPLVAGDQLPIGLIASIDTTTVYAGDYQIPLGQPGFFEWYHDFPYGVVIPNMSLVFQCTTAAHAMTVAAVWEYVSIDELDFFW